MVQQALESMDFHAIKVMKNKDPPQTAWINAMKTCLKDLVEWCKAEIKMGLDWKPAGEDPVAYFAACPLGSSGGAPKAAGGKAGGKGKAPPPPKGGFAAPPPDHMKDTDAKPAAPTGGGMSAIFAAIESGSTSGLKKVTDDMKCKNRKDDAALAPSAPKAAPAPKAAAGRNAKGPRGPPKKELQKDVNWIFENFDGDHSIVMDEADQRQCICLINCRNSTLRIGTRVKAIQIDGCEKVNVVTKDVISTVELVNSDRCQMQTDGKVNMISIDKCNGVQLYLNKDSIEAEIVTAKSSEMNVTIPDPDSPDDYIEIPIPEQFVTKVVGKKTKTEVSSLYSD
jgi:adenylyl cyclase-associated protein